MTNLLGTWTLQTHASSDLGYYKGSAYVVMHVMENPTQAVFGCHLDDCNERANQVCHQQDQCVDIKSNIIEWSDGTQTVLEKLLASRNASPMFRS